MGAPRRPGAYGDGSAPRRDDVRPQRLYSPGGQARLSAPGTGGQGGFEPRPPRGDSRSGDRRDDGRGSGFVPREQRAPVRDDGFARREPASLERPPRLSEAGQPRLDAFVETGQRGGQPRRDTSPMGGQALPDFPGQGPPASPERERGEPPHPSNDNPLPTRPAKGEAPLAGGPSRAPMPEGPALPEHQRGEQAGSPTGASDRPQNHQPQKQFLKMEDLAKIPPKQAAHNPVPDPARERASREDLRKVLSDRLSS